MIKTTNKIDVHHHIFPKEYVDAVKNAGVKNTFGVDFPKWSVEIAFKKMKENGIKLAMLSISTPGVYFSGVETSEGFSENLAHQTNEIIAGIKHKYPESFGGFATIPMLNQQAAIKELNYALDVLKLDGVCLMTNYLGKYLGDSYFDPFFNELNKRNAVVFIHPTDPGEEHDFKLGFPNALIEAPFDTTRVVANLMYNGILDKYPNITYILSHGGGTIPYIAWRLASIEYGQNEKRTPVVQALYDFLVNREPTKGLKHLKKMYYDTANVSGDYMVKTLQAFAGPDHIVFGSDLSISKLAPIITKNLAKDGNFTDEEYNKMSYSNCLRLFPAFNKLYDRK
ncbi:amidohydrolase family protein [Bacteroidota bacterium]